MILKVLHPPQQQFCTEANPFEWQHSFSQAAKNLGHLVSSNKTTWPARVCAFTCSDPKWGCDGFCFNVVCIISNLRGSANQTGLGTCRNSEPTTLCLFQMTPPCSAWCHSLKCGHSTENHFQHCSRSFHAKPFAFIWMDWHWLYEVTNSVHICWFLVDSWREFTQTQIMNDLMKPSNVTETQ